MHIYLQRDIKSYLQKECCIISSINHPHANVSSRLYSAETLNTPLPLLVLLLL